MRLLFEKNGSKDLVTNQKNEISFKTIKIGKQIWMSENLNVEKFLNGKTITEAKTKE